MRPHQHAMHEAFVQRQSTLLIAPTGSGKTFSGLLPSLIDLDHTPHPGLHTLYVSPLKALTNDIERNLMQPVQEMGLDVSIESRTGDTSSHKRMRQRKRPPNLLLTTPESLMLMLSYADAPAIFRHLKLVVVDEAHSLAYAKRGDFLSLALARLSALQPTHLRFGLSATVADPPAMAAWLGVNGNPAQIHQVRDTTRPDVKMLEASARMPYGGFMAGYAMQAVYDAICKAQTTLVFVNTRAQAELVFQQLWDRNEQALPIAVYHGSLSKEQRRKTEAMMAKGLLRAIVSTSALELGIDWGDVDLVIQIGAPKGVSRLLQRIGRSNHRMNEPSRALLVPANRFEALECQSALSALAAGELDGEPMRPGSLDIVPQFIMNCLCCAPETPEALFAQLQQSHSYRHVTRAQFEALFTFTINGGYALQQDERFQRLEQQEDGRYAPRSRMVVQRHRQNIGTIVEAARLKVKRVRKAHQGRIIGEVEEYFAQSLSPGDTFLFAGEVLAFIGIEDMILEASPATGGEAKIPSYVGGQMPLSTYLAEGVRQLLTEPHRWQNLPGDVREWLALQQVFSVLPDQHQLLIEHFPYRGIPHSLFYTFEGRKANQTLGLLMTRRMERMGLKPLRFSITDYGLSIATLQPLQPSHLTQLFTADLLLDELEEWMLETPMLKRSFRQVATISGLTEQRYAGSRKTLKQVTFSTDLIYDVLRRYDPQHVLLAVTREDAERDLLDMARLKDLLLRYQDHLIFRSLSRPSPLAIPIVLDVRTEAVPGSGVAALLDQASLADEAEAMMEAVRHNVEIT